MALTHLDEDGRPSMVDVGKKEITSRTAHAQAIVDLPEIVSCQLSDDEIHSPKGPVFSTAILAGIQAAKKTPDLIPLCHTVPLNDATICVTPNENARELKVDCKVSACHQTGVEMEALTGATIAALTIYDMTKALSRDVVIRSVRLMEKTGGKQDFRREN
jgi:cyclic pyranopterin phosphate synthase|tara:strand:- start:7256 stop:7735 length:480 start_codon:yes stop_codon:yes gene_type:complete